MRYISLLAAGCAAALLASAPEILVTPAHAAVGAAVEVGPNRAPPKLRAEVRPARPQRGWAWQRGHWEWRDNDYAWVNGMWAEPPHARAAWIPGHWNHRGKNWVWVDGHWT